MNKYFNTYFLYPLAEKALKRDIRSKVNSLVRYENLSKKNLDLIKKNWLYEILLDAKNNVPYYRDLFKEINFDPNSVKKDIKAIEQIPYLTKDILVEHNTRFLNERFSEKNLRYSRTAGSTGPALSIIYDLEAADWSAAAHLYAIKLTGKKRTDKEVHLSSQLIEKVRPTDSFVEWVKCRAMNRYNVYSHKMNPVELNRILNEIKNIRPYLIQGHPSTLFALANFARDNSYLAQNLFEVFESTGETLDEHKSSIISETFNCRVFNRYGSAEFGVIAHSKEPNGNMYLLQSLGVYETCDLGNGLEELVVTGLRNHAMPLIRYKTGDTGQILNLDGSRPMLSKVLGRKHDVIEVGDRLLPTHYIQDVIYRKPEIEEFQIVQKDRNNPLLIKLVTKPNSDCSFMRKYLTEHFGNNIQLEYTDFSGLTYRGWRGKFRYLVN
ncbi:MAG: hypothetical protein R2827_13605 [Bdellovibrionales bacterium]